MKQHVLQLPAARTAKKPGHILVVILVLMVVGITIVAMSLALVISTTQSLGGAMTADRVHAAAEGGIENAILKLLRDPTYTGEEMIVDDLPVTLAVTRGTQTVIVATAESGAFTQRYRVVLERISGVLTIISWQQID